MRVGGREEEEGVGRGMKRSRREGGREEEEEEEISLGVIMTKTEIKFHMFLLFTLH
jgi:hypothetical protein